MIRCSTFAASRSFGRLAGCTFGLFASFSAWRIYLSRFLATVALLCRHIKRDVGRVVKRFLGGLGRLVDQPNHVVFEHIECGVLNAVRASSHEAIEDLGGFGLVDRPAHELGTGLLGGSDALLAVGGGVGFAGVNDLGKARAISVIDQRLDDGFAGL